MLDHSDNASLFRKAHSRSQSELILELFQPTDLFVSDDGEPYATFDRDGHSETWAVKGKTFRAWLQRLYFASEKRAASDFALKEAVGTLAAQARFSGAKVPVYTRIARTSHAVYVDMCNEQWEAVEITPAGWRVLAKAPVKFIRTSRMKSFPTPVHGGSIDDLRGFLNISGDGAFQLVVAWLVFIYISPAPAPLLEIVGEQGAAKSTNSRVLLDLLDPSANGPRSLPRNEHDLAIAALQATVLIFDNLSALTHEQSNMLCRMVTGATFATRELYSDRDEVCIHSQRPVIINGINEVVSQDDLRDRTVTVELPMISLASRRTEEDFWSDFQANWRALIGSLFTAIGKTLGHRVHVPSGGLLRMADFIKCARAVERAFGWPAHAIERHMAESQRSASAQLYENSALVTALRTLIASHDWEGTTTELLKQLRSINRERANELPRSVRALSQAMTLIASHLRDQGIEFEKRRVGESGARLLCLSRRDSSQERAA